MFLCESQNLVLLIVFFLFYDSSMEVSQMIDLTISSWNETFSVEISKCN